ncbi:DUF2459 domain-containing protein [Sphingomonas sp. SUN039]|uniref:DUF2459 domain-containing protein n=1 Tax=Sphingomonas sp. SUN039 TaxID=2937787 RepID=UPI0021646719|nr:DUF2459 domain-containing protein [Sphingomonas sp. SUN039]UVO52770.1 DUF2459 domain-containing protein [Sphingomonas sp. SUN039]
MKPQKLIRIAPTFVLIPVGLYLAAAAILAHIPANANWREPATGTTIFIQTNGVHTGIVLPAGPGKWRAFGWGDRDFYLNTPRWQDIRPGTALSALVGSGDTLVHVDELGDFLPDENWRPIRLRAHEYARLHAYIAATVRLGPAIPGYTPTDRFYPARGRYSALNTCNVWTGGALKAAGVRTGIWTPFAGDVMRWVPWPPARPILLPTGPA